MEPQKKQHPVEFIRHPSPSLMRFPTKVGATVNFPRGLPGFETVHQYRFRMEEAFQPFLFMDAVGDNPLSFVCIDIYFIAPDYEVRLPRLTADRLALPSLSETAVFSIVTIQPGQNRVTANLMSPIIINLEAMMGAQVILGNSQYPVQYDLWETLKSVGGAGVKAV